MKHQYDWSKLGAGWRFEPRSASVRADALVHTSDRGSDRHFAIEELERGDDPAGLNTSYWRMLWPFAKDQLAKCRIEPKPKYDWGKLDAGWSVEGEKLQLAAAHGFKGWACWDIPVLEKVTGVPIGESTQKALDQLAKCRVDNTPLFEAIDKMAAEIPAEEWAKVSQADGSVVTTAPCPACGKHGLHLCAKWYPEPPSTKWFYPSQPWRRGPLAAWTLVNISCHDGRLTVVMKRGRGELVMETGPDDEVLWERLAQKVESYSTR